jgi:sarcosine oxidase
MTPALDAIVIGAGGAGAACLAALARRGLRVRGFESHQVGHPGCASTSTRVFRQAYPVEAETYVPLMRRAHELWRALEVEGGEDLLLPTGALEIGPRDHRGVAGVAETCRRFDLPFEVLEADEARKRYPALSPRDDELVVLEKQAGVLRAEEATRALLARAAEAGAKLREQAPVDRIDVDIDSVTVRVGNEAHTARYAVIAAGAGLPALLDRLTGTAGAAALPLRIARPEELWFSPEPAKLFRPGAMPPHSWAYERGSCFAVPAMLGDPLKVCYRAPLSGEDSAPSSDEERVRSFMRRSMPSAASAPCTSRRVSVATLTPDGHPLLGPHPACDRVLLAGGLSGHGFKLAPVLGEVIADLIAEGRSRHPIARFSPARFASANE